MKSEESPSPSNVLALVANALPSDVRCHVIIIGSLAAGYHFFAGDGARAIRTKGVDCLFSAHSILVEVTEELEAMAL